ncbi:MAG TPA: ATP-binding protein, partial [Longimicrobiales bacterium]|nr:ATP-binding protein [Longimicrobiales bacterium]
DENLRRLCGVDSDDEMHTLPAFLSLVHEEDRTHLSAIFARAAAVGGVVQSEFRIAGDDGARWLEVRGQTFTGFDGEPSYVTGACRDVTEQKRIEEELRDGEMRERFLARVSETLGSFLDHGSAMRALTDSVVPAIADFCLFDAVHTDGTVERVAWKYADAQRSAWFEATQRDLPPVSADRHPAGRVLASGIPELITDITEDWIVGNALSDRHGDFARELGVRSLIRVPMSVSGDRLGVFTLGMAESGRRYSERDLNLAIDIGRRAAATLHNARLYAELQEAIRARDEVTSIVSHDLRNPVNTITMAAALLTDFDLAAEKRHTQASVIRRCATQMTRLLDDLLEMSKAEGGRLTVETRPDDLAAIAREAFETFSLRAADLGLDLRFEVPDDLPRVLVDRHRIQQVLSNLLGNAVKFTPRGGRVTLYAEGGVREVAVHIEDTGIGIAKADLPHVFDRFWQAKRAERASAGLGLAIAKSIIESHGGRIWVESAEGRGTRFCFTVPVATGDESSA